MAYLLDVVREGTLLSHDFSRTYQDIIYEKTEQGTPLQIKIEDLLQVVLEYLKKNSPIKEIIVNKSCDLPQNNLYGMLMTKDSIAEIIVYNDLNKCWERFTICKELMQLYIDYSANGHLYPNGNMVKQINDLAVAQDNLINTKTSSWTQGSFSDDVSPEFQAISMAIDLVFPVAYKEVMTNVFANIELGKYKYFDVAYLFRMPEYVMKTYHKSFHQISLDIKLGSAKI